MNLFYECTWCGRQTNDWRELGTVCLAPVDGYPCPGMIDSADKLARERAKSFPVDV